MTGQNVKGNEMAPNVKKKKQNQNMKLDKYESEKEKNHTRRF